MSKLSSTIIFNTRVISTKYRTLLRIIGEDEEVLSQIQDHSLYNFTCIILIITEYYDTSSSWMIRVFPRTSLCHPTTRGVNVQR